MRLSNNIFRGARCVPAGEGFVNFSAGVRRLGLWTLLGAISMGSMVSTLSVVEAQIPSVFSSATGLPDGITRPGAGTRIAEKAPGEEAKKTTGLADAEMTRLVTALEERIRQLENRIEMLTEGRSGSEARPGVAMPGVVAATSAPVVTNTPSVAVKIDTARTEKEVADPEEEAKQNGKILKFLRDVEINGVVDGYYSYNTNQVDMLTQGRAFDVRHNAFNLQLARIGFNKAASTDSPLGFRLDVGLGETVDRIISVSDFSRNEATKHLLQAYVSYVAPVGKGLTIDFGKMYTPVGAEVIDTKDNFNYSRGWLFTYGPYYHTGFRAKYAFNDKVALTGFLFNGWDNLYENNHNRNAGKTTGLQLSLNPTKKFALTQTYLGGPEAPLANVPAVSARDNWRHIADTVASYLVTDKLTLTGNFVAGSDGDDAGKRGKWTGFSGYLKYAFNSRLAFSPRFEIFDDRDGLRTGTAQTVKGVTLTQEVKLVNNLLTRFEFRRDYSNRRFFTNASGTSQNHQNTFIIGLSYAFSDRGDQ
jgi:hypothetical protein